MVAPVLGAAPARAESLGLRIGDSLRVNTLGLEGRAAWPIVGQRYGSTGPCTVTGTAPWERITRALSNLHGVNERARRMEHRLEWPLLVAALLTIPAIAIEQSSAGQPWDSIATALNWMTWLAFLGELAVMLAVVPDRRRWLRDHPLEVAIVVLTPPFLPASLQAARVFRLLRLLRLAKAAVLVRRLLSTEGVRDAFVLAVVTVLGGGAAYSAIEKSHNGDPISAWDGVWWAITTVTTVGYGDDYPRTTGGRIIAIVVMFVGIGFVAILTAAAAERFTRERRADEAAIEQRLDEILRRLDAIERGK